MATDDGAICDKQRPCVGGSSMARGTKPGKWGSKYISHKNQPSGLVSEIPETNKRKYNCAKHGDADADDADDADDAETDAYDVDAADDADADAYDDDADAYEAYADADDTDAVYPESEDKKDRKPDDHCVQQARRLLHLFHFIQHKDLSTLFSIKMYPLCST